MLGLGETDAELERTFDDIRAAGVDVVTLGEYMRPTPTTCRSTFCNAR